MLPTLMPENSSWAYSASDISRRPPRDSLLEVLQDVARVLGLPVRRHPLTVLDLHDVQRQVADVVVRRERAWRRDHADPVAAQALETRDELVHREVATRPLERLG